MAYGTIVIQAGVQPVWLQQVDEGRSVPVYTDAAMTQRIPWPYVIEAGTVAVLYLQPERLVTPVITDSVGIVLSDKSEGVGPGKAIARGPFNAAIGDDGSGGGGSLSLGSVTTVTGIAGGGQVLTATDASNATWSTTTNYIGTAIGYFWSSVNGVVSAFAPAPGTVATDKYLGFDSSGTLVTAAVSAGTVAALSQVTDQAALSTIPSPNVGDWATTVNPNVLWRWNGTFWLEVIGLGQVPFTEAADVGTVTPNTTYAARWRLACISTTAMTIANFTGGGTPGNLIYFDLMALGGSPATFTWGTAYVDASGVHVPAATIPAQSTRTYCFTLDSNPLVLRLAWHT